MLWVARLELRAIATIAFFLFSITLGERIAQGAQTGTMTVPSARAIPVRPYSLQEARLRADSEARNEAQQPAGTRVFYVDDYYITYGPNKADSANVPIETVFSRGRNGTLYATQPDTGYVMTFPADATIQRENNVSEMFIAPGENVSPELRRLVSLGGARFVKVLGGSAGLPEPADPCQVGSFLGPIPGCSPTKRWGGGGTGSISPSSPQYLTALSNSCAITGKSIVSLTYNTPTTIPYNQTLTTSFCATLGQSVQTCYFFTPPDTPGSVHSRSVTYALGGDVGASLGFHFMDGSANNGAGSGTAPGCLWQYGCS